MRSPGQRVPRGIGAVVVLVTLLSTSAVVVSQEKDYSSTQTRMRGVFVTLATAYKFSLDPTAFEASANRREIISALQALADNASALESHGQELDPSFDYLKHSLARDAKEALSRFERGQYLGARWTINKLTENCVACHSKLPQTGAVDFTKGFLKEANVASLDPLARAELEIATRQFKTAMQTYEDVFTDTSVNPRTISITGAFENYLRLAVGVVGDRERAVRALSKFASRKDVPENLKKLVRGWMTELGNLNLDVPKGKELETARQMIDRARSDTRFPKDRSQQVNFIAAATILHEFLRAHHDDPNSASEAYYLLGVAESYISRSYWISETQSLLEKAIRTAPKSESARAAYEFLEEYMLSGYTVSAREVPADAEKYLAELRELIGR